MLQLLDDRVLVKRRDAETKVGEIVIPSMARGPSVEAVVVAVGPGMRVAGETHERARLMVRVHDVVLLQDYAGVDRKVDGVDHVIVREHEIMAVLSRRCGLALDEDEDGPVCSMDDQHDGDCANIVDARE